MKRGPKVGGAKELDRMEWDAWIAKLRKTEPRSFVDAVVRLAGEPDEPIEADPVEAPVRVRSVPEDRTSEREAAARERACEAAYGDRMLHHWQKPGEVV